MRRALGTLALLFGSRLVAQAPLDRAHAHNDYEHTRPLRDALERGYGSVEADIYLVNGALLVAHDRDSVRADRTLESLYLAPLRAWVASHEGRVHANRPALTLLIDLKSNADSTWPVLDATLRRYAGLIAHSVGDSVIDAPVVAILSGERPLLTLPAMRERWAGLDGRLPDLDGGPSASAMPLISDNWKNVTEWKGDGRPPRGLRATLDSLVQRAHAQGRRIRFWGTPDREVLWRMLYDAGVDLIGADDLGALQHFLARR